MNSAFHIYSASAGSGKTFTLAKSYLKLLIASKNPEQFKHILALTFTNKAVSEMKTRIIDMLKTFSGEHSLTNPHPMFSAICEELQITPSLLKDKSKDILTRIIHNYAAFDISTIDGFTHRVIRTFAFDLKLPVNFEVELDTDVLLSKAVESLISKAGTHKELTNILVDFAIEKANDDKSWDISYDFNKIAKLLVSENDLFFINKIKHKTLEDFKILKRSVTKKIKENEAQIVNSATQILTLIQEAGLQFNDFSGSYLPKYFEKLVSKNFDINYKVKWQDNLDTKTLYPKRVNDDIASIIKQIQPDIAAAFSKSKAQVFETKFLKAIYKNITPLSVLNAIQNELQTIKNDENKLLISEFNSLISNEIKNQPTPFIYERLGEKFRHYFIDEFQDTSKMQWQNLVPLLDNALSSAYGSTMIVGDAKQAIYSWRGGEAQQFIKLYNKEENPFQIQSKVFNLKSNYRSFKEIVDFNNSFFSFISTHFFTEIDYKNLYAKAHQNQIKDDVGYVNLSFLDIKKEDNREELYVIKTFETVNRCLENNYALKDISILVRKKKEAIAISNYLSQQGISIVSSETLLIKNSPKVELLHSILSAIINPEDQKLKAVMLHGLSEFLEIRNKHSFIKTHLDLTMSKLLSALNDFDITLNYQNLLQIPLYEVVESIIRGLSLIGAKSDAYVQFYLDTVLDYSQKQIADISGFIDYFEKKKNNLSIALPDNLDAVTVMTIHKSKGLEFPVVIFPFADLNIYGEIEPKSWFPLDSEDYNGFDYALINYTQDFQNYGILGEDIYHKHQSELELESINLLYVTLTRAVEHLYIISKKDINSKGVISEKSYAGLFIQYLIKKNLWEKEKHEYHFGDSIRTTLFEPQEMKDIGYEFISTSKESHNLKIITNGGYLWDTEQEQAIERGNLIHLIMSKINTIHDVDFVFDSFLNSGQIKLSGEKELKNMVYSIINHKEIQHYYTDDYKIYNEKDIISSNGNYIRPDRLVIKNDNAIIIDYKTGIEDLKHKIQLDNYASVIHSMGFQIEKKLIVYINNSIKIVEV